MSAREDRVKALLYLKALPYSDSNVRVPPRPQSCLLHTHRLPESWESGMGDHLLALGRRPAGLKPRLLGSSSLSAGQQPRGPIGHAVVPGCWGRGISSLTEVTGQVAAAHIPGSCLRAGHLYCARMWQGHRSGGGPPLTPMFVSGLYRRKSWYSCWPSTATCSSAPRWGARLSRNCCPAASPPSCTGPSHQSSGLASSLLPTPRSAFTEPGHLGSAASFGAGGLPLGNGRF